MEEKVGILVGGGPAPGINSVIGTATIRCELDGAPVIGIRQGFRWLMEGDTSNVTPLTIDGVSRIHFRGGSILGTSRANPTKDPDRLAKVVAALRELGVTGLITIGGDDTAFSAMKVAEAARGSVRVVHVPKTIDNDLSLPPNVDTFGYQTARHVGVNVLKTLMEDAETTRRWYFAIAMGRKAGHLALGIGKAAGATITLIPEEFGAGPTSLGLITDILAGSILKRRALGDDHGVAVIAEGVVLGIPPEELADLEDVERDDHGHVRIAEIPVGTILKKQVKRRLAEFDVQATIVDKNIGYELRCADPVPSDLEYTRDLGFCAARYLLDGNTGVMVTMQGGHFVPMRFGDLLDPDTGRTRVRMVDVQSTGYAIARQYMIRLEKTDFADDFAGRCGLDPARLRAAFGHVVENGPVVPPLRWRAR